MTVGGFLEQLRQRGITIWVDGDLLRCSAPAGVLTSDLRAQLQERKPEILEFLNSAKALGEQPRGIVPLQPFGTRTPVFAVPGHNGDVFCYRALAHHLGDDQPFFGLQPPGVDGECEPLTSVQDIASYFADQIRSFRPNECYILAGYCAGGTVAFELARQLRERGSPVGFVAVIAAPHPAWFRPLGQLRYRLSQQIERVRTHLRALASRSHRDRVAYITDKVRAFRQRRAARRAALPPDPLLVVRGKVEAATVAAVRRYEPRYFPGRLIRFLPTREWLQRDNALLSWKSLARETETYCGPDGCPVDQLLRDPYAPATAEMFRRCVDKATVEKPRQPVAAA